MLQSALHRHGNVFLLWMSRDVLTNDDSGKVLDNTDTSCKQCRKGSWLPTIWVRKATFVGMPNCPWPAGKSAQEACCGKEGIFWPTWQRCDASVRLLQAHRLVRICKNRSQWPRERTHEAEGGPVLPAQCRVIVWAPACSCQFIRPSSSPFTTTRSDFRRQRDGNGIHRFPLLLHWGKIASG